MSFEFVEKLPVPAEIKEQFPMSDALCSLKARRDEEIRRIFTGEDSRFLMIIGPCSADNPDAIFDYLHRLRAVQDKTADKLLIIPRIYTNKPRTNGDGYKGLLHQPDPDKEEDLMAGLIAIRRLHMEAIRETGLPAPVPVSISTVCLWELWLCSSAHIIMVIPKVLCLPCFWQMRLRR